MTLQHFKRGHTLYKEGVSEVDGIYFIKDGDFEMTQDVGLYDKKVNNGAKRALRRGVSDLKTDYINHRSRS